MHIIFTDKLSKMEVHYKNLRDWGSGEEGKLLIQSLEWLPQILSKWTYSEDLRDVNFSHVCMKHKPVNQLVNLWFIKIKSTFT